MTDDQVLAQFHRDIVEASIGARRRFKLYDLSWFRINEPHVLRDGWRKVASFNNRATAETYLDVLWRATAIRNALSNLAGRQICGSTKELIAVLVAHLDRRPVALEHVEPPVAPLV